MRDMPKSNVMPSTYLPPLESVKLPLNMSAELAKDLGRLITGHSRETDLVRYIALALHYVSWTVNRDASLKEYEERLMGLSPESSFQLLEVFTLPTAFALQGLDNGMPRALVRAAQKAANDWKRQLEEHGCNALKLHQRTMALIADMLDDEYELQDASANEMRMAVLARHPELQMRQAASGARPPSSVQAISVDLLTPSAESGARHFTSPVEALQYVFQQLHAARAEQLRATGDTPALTQVTSKAEPGSIAAPVAAGPTLRLFNPAQAIAALQRSPGGPGEGNAQQRRLLDQLSRDTGWRVLTEVPTGNPLQELYERFPHFTPVLDYVCGALALAACGQDGSPVRVAPLLLRGVPGTGKTFFAQELARVLKAHFVERDLSVTSEAFVIAGMDSGWKNSKPGVVFDALVNGKTANPVICLNEVDKARESGTHSSPLAALHALLEPTSAEHFTDEFVPVALDARQVVWVLTANDGHIPEPILSRLEIFDIPAPTREQCRVIAQSVWSSLCERLFPKGHGFEAELGDSLLSLLESTSPRVMRKALTAAASSAALDGRKYLRHTDLTGASARYALQDQRRPIGFTTSM